jgi:hypothetical protein
VNPELGGNALPLALIHPPSGNRNSANFAFWGFSKVRGQRPEVRGAVRVSRGMTLRGGMGMGCLGRIRAETTLEARKGAKGSIDGRPERTVRLL